MPTLFNFLAIIFSIVTLPVLAKEDFDATFQQAEIFHRQGQYNLALDNLKTARELAGSAEQKGQTLGLLGLTHYRIHRYQQADALLQEAVNSSTGQPSTRARWYCALAALKANQDQPEQAQRLYADALKLAADNAELQVTIQLGQAQLMPATQRLSELQRIYTRLTSLNPAEARITQLLNIAAQSRKLRSASKLGQLELAEDAQKQITNTSLKLAYEALQHAKSLTNAQQPRLWAEVLDSLAQLYEDENRIDEALFLNGQAVQSARQVQADDLLLDLEWRQGRLYRAKKQAADAIAAYERAVAHIEVIRQDIPVEYHDGRSSFRDTLEPVYLGLADLLLTEANKQTGINKTRLLQRARDSVELIKQSELADFLGGRCAIAIASANRTRLDTLAAGTAVLYPIILPDRLELLVSYGQDIQHYSQPITSVNLHGLILSFAHGLRYGTEQAQAASKELYALLIAPIQATLQQQQIQTLVWVPDGPLRLISPAALYDGEQYLIEKYAVATSPGLTLFESLPMQVQSAQALLAGLSEPGPVLEHLPPAWVNTLTTTSQRGIDLKKARSRALPMSQQLTTDPLPNSPGHRQTLKQRLSLPGVEQEMHNLQKGIINTLLFNETFTVDNFKKQLLQQPYAVVHIASHGVFGNSADNSFVMAYDDLISMNQLEQLLKADKFKKQPVQLLTLSACQTAEGDDRAPLGLSGIAIKAKVRTALGTLWPVDDEAASQLMAEFYKNLSKPGFNKAQALQHAQLSLLKQKELTHPYFWSPFILVGNWL